MSLDSFLSLCTGLTKLEKLIYFSRSFSIGFNTLLFLLPLLILQFHPPICDVLHCPRWQNFSRMFCIRKQNLTLTIILVKCWGVIALQGRHRSQHLQSCSDTYCCSLCSSCTCCRYISFQARKPRGSLEQQAPRSRTLIRHSARWRLGSGPGKPIFQSGPKMVEIDEI